MSATMKPARDRGVFLTRVIANEPLCREHWRFVLEVEGFPSAEPGQFVQILCADPTDDLWRAGAFIRRPFSIAGLRRAGSRCELEFLHRAIGVGTRWLARLKAGDSVSVLGPLGQPFPLLPDRPVAYLVGGGIGLPPLMWLAEKLHHAGRRAVAFCGARSADLVPMTRVADLPVHADEPALTYEEFARSKTPVVLATDDGTLGARGLIPDAFARYLDGHRDERASTVVYTCGPNPMMEAAARVAQQHGLPCYACLERVMACGMGTCQSCVVKVRDDTEPDGWRYQLCCTDGPVFESRCLIWET